MANRSKSDAPKAVLWLESSITALHLQHIAMLSRQLCAKGIDVVVLTSEDTIARFERNGGVLKKDGHCAVKSEIDFGDRARFELPPLPSQTTYEKDPKVDAVYEPAYRPFDFLGSEVIRERRDAGISRTITKEKPDIIVTSLWPGGYGPFTPEVESMLTLARQLNTGCKVYSLSNDIPYLDDDFNDRYIKSGQFALVDRTFVRGDGSIRLDNYFPGMTQKTADKMEYVGHFVNPLPPRTPMPDSERPVLVTYGTRENDWHGRRYVDYFCSILDAAPKTPLKDHPWKLIVGPRCRHVEFEQIKEHAEYIASQYSMKIEVEQRAPDKKFRQETADAVFRICQYDIFVLDDISTGVPAVVTTGNLGEFMCGANEGDYRLRKLIDTGAPITYSDQNNVRYAGWLDAAIKHLQQLRRQKDYNLPHDAPEIVAATIASDYRAQHPEWSPAKAVDPQAAAPDPVISEADSVTPQKPPRRRSK